MDNPNAYNDEEYSQYSVETEDAIGGLWEAGAGVSDIEDVLANALENATGARFSVSLQVRQ